MGVNIRVLVILILLNLIFLAGCVEEAPVKDTKLTGEVVKDDVKKIEDTAVTGKKAKDEADKEKKDSEVKKTEESKAYEKQRYYDLEKLQDDINQIVNITYNWTRDPTYPDYVRSSRISNLKYYVIHTIGSKENFADTVNKFCEKYCAANWDGWQYYVNMSDYRSLFPLLSRSDFPTEERYREYLRDATYVNYTFIETSYDLKHGKVLEYQLISWRLDNSLKYFEGARDGTFLIYKIYCSPNMTVLLTPRWEVYKMLLPSMTLEDSYKTWNYYIISIRSEFLNKSNELLERCPANREFFGDYKFPTYYKSELLTGYWKVYYSRYFNLSSSLEIGAKPKSSSIYVLNQINVSYTNDEDVDLWNAETEEGVNLRIDVIADGHKETTYFNKRIEGILEPGKSIKRNFDHFEIEFYDNVTVKTILYVEENVELKPMEKTLSKKDIIKE